MASNRHADHHTNRLRAAKACRRCNQRRIKCDALERGTPCTRCRQSDNNDCILIQSKRGTYSRKEAKAGHATKKVSSNSERITVAQDSAASQSPLSSGQQSPSTASQRKDEGGAPVSQSPPQLDQLERGADTDCPPRSQDILMGDASIVPPAVSVTAAPPGNPDLASPESDFTEASTSSYREVSWTAMFEHFLESRRRDHKDVIDKCSITYLGESFPLAIVLGNSKEGGKLRLHHPGPPLDESSSRVEESNNQVHPAHMLPEDINFLRAKKAFDYPAADILAPLISTFLDQVFPLYPIVNRQEFLNQYKNKTIPWILLHSLCFIGATYCPVSILHRAGFTGRKQARFSYYRKAKALFDTGYESNKIVTLQSVILLTFWGGGPNTHWNFYSWIGTGVTIAETIGIHRSLAATNMSCQDRSLLKRLWWVLVIRDASCGALVGRPFRINMDHSDTEMLTAEDFEHDSGSREFAENPLNQTFGLYQIHMSKLSLILREIVVTRFDPGRKIRTSANLDGMLQNWRQELPPELRWSEHSMNLNVFATTLSIVFDHHLILAHLGQHTTEAISSIADNGSSNTTQRITEAAAQRISAAACSIVTRSQVLLMPHETFQGLFLAEVVFYTQMKSSVHIVAQFGRTALNSCQMALHDAREAWDPAPWVMNLFNNLIRNLKEDSPSNEMDLVAGPFGINYQSGSDVLGAMGREGQTCGEYDSWQTNSMLASLFDMPYDPNVLQTFQPSFDGLEQSGII